MKKIFTIIAVAAVALVNSLGMNAEEKMTVLSVYMKDGSTEMFKFADKPSVTMADHKIAVQSDAMSGEYDFENVSHFAFEDGNLVMGIEDIAGDETAFAFSYTDNATVYVAAPELKWVAVYSIQGVEMTKVAAADNGTAIVDVSNLAPGVYVVAPSCHSAVKIVKK